MGAKKWMVGMVMSSLAALVAAGCGTAGTGNQTTQAAGTRPVAGGNIEMDSAQNFRDFDPAIAYDAASDFPVLEMYDQLVTYNGNTTDTKPMVATKWDVSADGKTYTFHLRKDAKFWNGDPVTAQSFVDEFQRVLTKSLASPGQSFIDPLVVGADAYFTGKANTISGVSASDPNTLVIHLTTANTAFLKIMSMPFFSAVDIKVFGSADPKAIDNGSTVMGSGPFELAKNSSNELVLKKNPHYWMTDANGTHLPYLDQVTVKINQNTQLDAMRFEQGTTALLGNLVGIPSSAYPTISSDPKFKGDIIKATQNQVYYLGINENIKPFNNPLVRKAIEYGVDKAQVLKLENGRGIVADQPIPTGLPGHVSSLSSDATYSYDPTKAKALLKQAGFPNGVTVDLYSANDPDIVKLDTAIQSQLKDAGINVQIKDTSWATFLDRIVKGQAGLFYLAWSPDYPDPSDFLQPFVSTNPTSVNTAMYKNSQVDTWMSQAVSDQNATSRQSLLGQVTNQVMNDAPWVPLYYPTNYYAVQPWVHGYYISPILPDPIQYIWIDKSHK